MAARTKPYEQFGSFILFKKLEWDPLGDLWRAARIENGTLGPFVAVRRLTGGNRAALSASAQYAGQIVPQLTGTSFVRNQSGGVADGIPYLAWEYSGGRSLRFILERARGSREVAPNPLPIDQAIAIADKIALSLSTMAELRDVAGNRLAHGSLLPHFVWITDDGEIRVGGQQMGQGLVASLADPKTAGDIAPYFTPESRDGQLSKSADVYSLGAILFLMVTGQEPPDAATASAFGAAVRAAKTTTGAPIPDDIRIVLDKSFNIDASKRYASIAEMKQAISALATGGKYTATTFNLAFYLSSLLKKDLEIEAADRERESKINVAAYLDAPRIAAPDPAAPAAIPTMFKEAAASSAPAKAKSRAPVGIAAAVMLLAALGGGAWFFLGRSTPAVTPSPAAAALPAAQPAQPRVISEPVLASTAGATGAVTATSGTATDPEAQKKAFEDAVKAKLQAEMMKLQNDYMAELKQRQSKNAPVQEPEPQAEERPAVSAAQLDQQRRDNVARTETAAAQATQSVPAPVQTTPAQSAPAVVAQAPAPVQAPAVREGDVVDVARLDVVPRPVRPISAVYPPLARQYKIAATVIVSALIDETGTVGEVKVLRGEPRFGINDAAIRAMRATKFSPPMKDGKRVRTWFPQTMEFRP
jgi:TonB family protein